MASVGFVYSSSFRFLNPNHSLFVRSRWSNNQLHFGLSHVRSIPSTTRTLLSRHLLSKTTFFLPFALRPSFISLRSKSLSNHSTGAACRRLFSDRADEITSIDVILTSSLVFNLAHVWCTYVYTYIHTYMAYCWRGHFIIAWEKFICIDNTKKKRGKVVQQLIVFASLFRKDRWILLV